MVYVPKNEKDRWKLVFLKLSACFELCPLSDDSEFIQKIMDLCDYAYVMFHD